jgi:alanyl-tRNA synthetase
MTELLYYHDSYAVDFKARIVERLTHAGRPGVVLDRTLFYPTSGGQPFDLGSMNDIHVEGVLVRDQDGAVVHLLSTEIESADIRGKVDWSRRFDHMQQHTGQHILSQAFERVAGATTVGFHMSAETSTLDLDIGELTQEQIQQAEQLANKIVWEDRDVSVRFVPVGEAKKMPLRKLPPDKNGVLRLVEVTSFDLSACGGTHVRRTGEIGIVKVVKTERQSGKCRVEFLCGDRALADYDRKNLVLGRLSKNMTTGYWDLENSIAGLRDDLKQAKRSLKRKTNELIQFETRSIAANAIEIDGVNLIRHAFKDRDPAELRRLASSLASNDRTIVLFGLAGAKAHLLFARSDDLELSVNDLLSEVLPLLGDATGGGSPKFAQGGGPPATEPAMTQVLADAEKYVRDVLTRTVQLTK